MRILPIIATTIIHAASCIYALSLLAPALYCAGHSCSGPDLDGFMPAFFISPIGIPATIGALRHAIKQIRARKTWSPLFWPPAIVSGLVIAAVGLLMLAGIFVLIAKRPNN